MSSNITFTVAAFVTKKQKILLPITHTETEHSFGIYWSRKEMKRRSLYLNPAVDVLMLVWPGSTGHPPFSLLVGLAPVW